MLIALVALVTIASGCSGASKADQTRIAALERQVDALTQPSPVIASPTASATPVASPSSVPAASPSIAPASPPSPQPPQAIATPSPVAAAPPAACPPIGSTWTRDMKRTFPVLNSATTYSPEITDRILFSDSRIVTQSNFTVWDVVNKRWVTSTSIVRFPWQLVSPGRIVMTPAAGWTAQVTFADDCRSAIGFDFESASDASYKEAWNLSP